MTRDTLPFPVVDLDPWFRGERDVTRDAFDRACTEIGFFYLTNAGLDERLLASAREAARAFFALPLETKLELHFEKARKQRGYIPLRAESSDPEGKGDDKEALDFTFSIAPEGVSDAVAYRMYGENLWPASLPGFRETIDAYFAEMIRIGRVLFEVLAASLDLPTDYFRDKIDRPIAQLRLLHYPPLEGPVDARYLGIGAHCDYECFTLLDPGEVSGLEIQPRGKDWIEVPVVPNAFVVNLGEMLARWTNDRYLATPHRVVNRSGRERYTIPFFFATNYDAVIEPLRTCVMSEHPAKYPPVLAGEYLARRLNEVYGSLPEAGHS